MFLHLDLEGWILENLVDQAGVKKVYTLGGGKWFAWLVPS